ncbi:protein arginine kinase [Senegalia massiliensis]|uniref:Protein-arginine kinase n=1 Tax=Senegalia massiliensis TaxID=1720316 RepID=A0A845R3L0_9CLOT|nr:protein arginine kinase [Senegalia massiliensis]NBI08022.1 protein arginine kinase [Senegalia massiliensis]
MKWLDCDSCDQDIVVSSRIRLARNIENIKFPQKINKDDSESVKEQIKKAVTENDEIGKNYRYYDMKNLNIVESRKYVEDHLISPGLLEHNKIGGFLLSEDEKSTIMINEEDHIRMQVLYPGFELEKCFDESNRIDDILEGKIKYAFDEKIGYLTSCPTNIGTGMRASVMLHLPSLVITNQINGIIQAVNQIGLTVRGVYGEGSNAMGNLFQISNQTTIGESEDDIIQKLKNIVNQLVKNERNARSTIYTNNKIRMEDKVCRSLGTLKNARILSTDEAMSLLSDVKLGIEMSIIDNIDRVIINKLMIEIQPAHILNSADKDLDANDRDILRAKIVRESLEEEVIK